MADEAKVVNPWEDRRREAHRAETKANFERSKRFAHMGGFRVGQPVFEAVKQAMWDIREYRQAYNQLHEFYDEVATAVTATADALAIAIEDAASSAAMPLDDDTIRWVVAGMRCPARPFCTGCASCQTITSPLRPMEVSRG